MLDGDLRTKGEHCPVTWLNRIDRPGNFYEEWLMWMINSFMTGPLLYRNQSIDLRSKSLDWFLCDNDLRKS